MKARVNTFLNIRTGTPEILPDNNQGDAFFKPGDTVEIVDAKAGDEYKNNNVWFKLDDGSFVWSGGFNNTDELVSFFESTLYSPWMLNLKIPEIWKFSKGENVGIGIIDTGIDLNNKDLEFDKANFYLYDEKKSLQDVFGHGTHCAALIGAKNKKGKFIGVAPKSNLYICKFSELGSLSDEEIIRYADAINWCSANKNIHIISISWGGRIKDADIKKKVEDAVIAAVKNNKIIICSIGDASQDNDNSMRYPACYDDAIGIGAIPVDGKLYSFLNEHLLTMAEGLDIFSYKPDAEDLISMSGTSQSNAIVAGLVALIVKRLNFAYTPAQIKNLLKELSEIRQIMNKPLPCLSGEKLFNFFKT